MLMHSPEVAGRTAQLGTYVRFESTLAPVERELTILTAARECDCAFEWAAHVPLAREAGVREEAIAVVGRRGELDALQDEEAFIVRYGRELLTDHRVGETTFAAARSRLGERRDCGSDGHAGLLRDAGQHAERDGGGAARSRAAAAGAAVVEAGFFSGALAVFNVRSRVIRGRAAMVAARAGGW